MVAPALTARDGPAWPPVHGTEDRASARRHAGWGDRMTHSLTPALDAPLTVPTVSPRLPEDHRGVSLPESWRRALTGLRPAPAPTGEALPLDLHTVVQDAQASMTQPRRWEALLSHVNRVPHTRDLAAQWQVSPTRVTILGERGLNNLRVHASTQAWPDVLWALAEQPRAVTVPPETEVAWPVLVTACRTHGRSDLRTAPLEAGTWVLYRGPALIDYRHTPVTAGALLSPGEAARALQVSAELLEVVWPLTQLRRTQAGSYVGRPRHWTVQDWLSLLRATAGGQVEVSPDLVIEAFRALPDVPPYQASTLLAALRREPCRSWLGRPSGRQRRACHAPPEPLTDRVPACQEAP